MLVGLIFGTVLLLLELYVNIGLGVPSPIGKYWNELFFAFTACTLNAYLLVRYKKAVNLD